MSNTKLLLKDVAQSAAPKREAKAKAEAESRAAVKGKARERTRTEMTKVTMRTIRAMMKKRRKAVVERVKAKVGKAAGAARAEAKS